MEQVPQTILVCLRRIHQNLCHPTNNELFRYLAQQSCSAAALIGAKALHCDTCHRTAKPHVPRPTKMLAAARRFGDRLLIDMFWIALVTGTTVLYLSMLNDASVYHVCARFSKQDSDSFISLLMTLVPAVWLPRRDRV